MSSIAPPSMRTTVFLLHDYGLSLITPSDEHRRQCCWPCKQRLCGQALSEFICFFCHLVFKAGIILSFEFLSSRFGSSNRDFKTPPFEDVIQPVGRRSFCPGPNGKAHQYFFILVTSRRAWPLTLKPQGLVGEIREFDNIAGE